VASTPAEPLGAADPLFEQFLEFAPDAIVDVDANGRIMPVNRQTERLFGYERGELLCELIEVLVPERFRGDHVGHRSGYFKDPKTRPMGAGLDLYGLRKDGSEFPAEISLSSMKTGEGLLLTAVVRDVSERVHAAREREALKLQLRHDRTARLESLASWPAA
jgi:PAS domain S-box-containing protein